MLSTRTHPLLASILFVIVAWMAAPVFADDEIKIPQTAAEHEARAKIYKDQVAEYRKGAAEHRRMAEEYARQHPDPKGSPKNAWTQKMTKHCQMIVKDFEKLATDAEKAADYHSMRAKELKGG